MIRSMYTSATGINAHRQALDLIANNLANLNTIAFKRSETAFSDLLYHQLREKRMAALRTAAQPEPQAGQGTRVAAVTPIWEQGILMPSERPLDLAVEGEGFFRIELPDGTTAYTRAGSFSLDANGRLVTAAGYPVSVPFTLEAVRSDTLSVSPAGLVSALDTGGNPVELGALLLYSFVNPEGLVKVQGQLFLESGASGPPAEGTPGENGLGKIRQYALEQSNVFLSREMTLLLVHQRALQAAARSLTTADELQGLTLQVTL